MEVRKGLRHHVAFKEGISPSEVEWVTAELGAVIAAHTEDEAWQLMPTFEIVGSRRRQPNRCDGRKDLDVLFSCKPPRGRRDGGGFRCGWPRDIIAESQYEKVRWLSLSLSLSLFLSLSLSLTHTHSCFRSRYIALCPKRLVPARRISLAIHLLNLVFLLPLLSSHTCRMTMSWSRRR